MWAAIWLCLTLGASSAVPCPPRPTALASAPHRYHVTLAQADYNLEAGALEVALRINPFDLEAALTKAHGSKVDLDRTKDVDKHIERYLEQHFVLTDPKGKQRSLRWVGKEDFTLEMWLYFELPVVAQDSPKPADLSGYKLTNTLLLELNLKQTNALTYGRGKSRKSLRFSADQRHAKLEG